MPELGPGLLRQSLMILVVGLVVARPLVLGEDPGLLSEQSDPTGLVLTMLWLVAAGVWAVWRVWSRQDDVFAGVVEAALGGVVILVFGTAYGVAAYQHPARLIAWEWLAMLLALFLVRQLTVPAEEQHGMLSALLASGISLAALGLYQAFYDLPQMWQKYPTVESLRSDFAGKGSFFAADDPYIQLLFERLHQANVFGTFAHPNSYAGYLALLLPALVGAAVLALRSHLAFWQKVLAGIFAAMGVVALWCTHSRGALLASAVVGVVVAVIAFRRELWPRRIAVGGAFVVAVAALVGVYMSGLLNTLLGKQETTAAARSDYWRASWAMIREHPWLGVGPGNFGSLYTRYMAETAAERIKDPHNFLLEIWATSGLFALLALVVAVAAFFYYLVRAGRRSFGLFSLAPAAAVEPTPGLPATWGVENLPPIRWTFYLGGMFGMLLGFVLRATYQPKEAIVIEAVLAGLQSILWFAAFALFEQIRWTPRARALVLTGGVTALLLNLLVSGGLSFPSVAIMLWVVVALALNAAGAQPLPRLGGNVVARFLPLPVLIALPLTYFFIVLLPVSDTVNTMQAKLPQAQRIPDGPPDLDENTAPYFRAALLKEAVRPLEEMATKEDTDNADLEAHLARLYGRLWSCTALMQPNRALPPEQIQTLRDAAKAQGLKYAAAAQRHDPHGQEGYFAEYELHQRMANFYANAERKTLVGRSGDAMKFAVGHGARVALNQPAIWHTFIWDRTQPADKNVNYLQFKVEWELAAKVLLRFLEHDPTDPRLHFQIAEALYQAEAFKEEADQHAARALAIDGKATHLSHRLTDPQRKHLRQRLGIAPES